MKHGKNRTQPLRYYAHETVICYHCDYTGTWKRVVDHHSKAHPNDSLVVSNGSDRKTCALCTFRGSLGIHFKQIHKTIPKGLNPLQITTSIILQKLKNCPNFSYICCGKFINRECILEHMQQHGNTCTMCNDFETKDIVRLWMHKKEAHGKTNIEFQFLRFEKSLKEEFLQTEVVFENGLVLTNRNLIGTPHNLAHEFAEAVKSWIEILKVELEKEKRNALF